MSFSSAIKDELCRVEPGAQCCKRAELAAAYIMNSAGGAPQDSLVTENAAFARRVFRLLREMFEAPPDIIVKKKQRLKKSASYTVHINSETSLSDILYNNKIKKTSAEDETSGGKAGAAPAGADVLRRLTKKKCCKKAALRGAFRYCFIGGPLCGLLEKNGQTTARFSPNSADCTLTTRVYTKSCGVLNICRQKRHPRCCWRGPPAANVKNSTYRPSRAATDSTRQKSAFGGTLSDIPTTNPRRPFRGRTVSAM